MKKSIGAKTILYPTPVLIVGTYDKDGNPLTPTQFQQRVSSNQPYYQKEQNKTFGFNTGDPIYSAVNPLSTLSRLDPSQTLEISEVDGKTRTPGS